MAETCETMEVLRNGNPCIINVEDFDLDTDEKCTEPDLKLSMANSKEELQSGCVDRGLEFDDNAKKADLLDLIYNFESE